MSLQKIHLRKLLHLMFADQSRVISVLRADIRDEIRKQAGQAGEGGDFHAPFWFDAKNHVNGELDLRFAVAGRIAVHKGRERLYNALTKGFLDWWNNKRRWTNEPSTSEMLAVRGQLEFPRIGCTVKIENLLAMTIGASQNRIIYPYFSEEPSLNQHSARLGLWAIAASIDDYSKDELRILDVMRGRSFAISDVGFAGDEEAEFVERYEAILKIWNRLWEEYQAA